MDRISSRWVANTLKALERYREERQLAFVARSIRVHPNRLSEILKGKRELTEYYLGRLLTGGFVTIEQLLGGKKLEDLSPEERRFIERFMLKDATMDRIAAVRDRGLDLDNILDSILGRDFDKK